MQIIFNPKAGHGRGRRSLKKLEQVLRRRQIDYQLLQTLGPGHATEMARRLADARTRRLVVMGGDGSIGEVINGILHSDVALGIIPVGTGNDLARSLGLPVGNLEASVDVLLQGKIRPIDIGWERDRHFVLMMGLGFPETVASETNQMRWLKGPAAFFCAVYKAVHRLRPYPVRMKLDEGELEQEVVAVLVQNTPYCGGGQLMAPGAQVDDGYFDVVVVGRISKIDLMLNFPKVYSGRHLHHPSFSMYRSREVRVESQVPLKKMFDGDICGQVPVEARVLPQAVRMIVPSHS